ncbi:MULTISPECIES: hypothetical protein [Spirulina sp. CCY15215]|uniref:phosphoribosyltransferase-like protein n=1 Tax=Spirulina sp. CCY15215 TaxID=2767591 RepID=UPI00194F853E|nr:hypothetical protein [Spirulina major]
MTQQDLLESISQIICDYRLGEIPPMTPDHVNRWICQFENNEQLPILQELNYLLKKYYFSRSRAKSCLEKSFFNTNKAEKVSQIQFLDIQKRGNSQKELLKLANEITISRYSINLYRNILKPIGYVYLDDCLFSGNRVYHDLKDWLEQNIAISHTNIFLIFFALHTSGKRYVEQSLATIARERNIRFIIDSDLEFSNLHWEKEKYECLWPKQINNNPLVDQFVNLVEDNCRNKNFNPRLFRPDLIPKQETLCSSPQARNVIEAAFLKQGSYIVSLPEKRQHSMRPMGFEYFESLGFGSMFITYRNIANNCPLVLWWGDPINYSSSHPFSKWYPLFPRKVN